MHALIAFFIGPVGRYVGLALLVAAVVGGVLWKARTDGAADATSRIERANNAARDAADRGQQPVTECKGTWNRGTGKCEK